MLGQLAFPGPSFTWLYDNNDAPTSSVGTACTFGASSSKGSWTAMASSANIAQDVYGFVIEIGNTAENAVNHNCVLDIGVDPAGGTSYSVVIPDILCGKSTSLATGNNIYLYFPLFIKAGSSVAVRGSTSVGSALTARIRMVFWGRPRNPHLVRVGQYAEGIGTVSSGVGVSFTPVNGSEGSWASLGSTTRALWWLVLTFGINNATITVQYTHIDLAVGDGTNYDIIQTNIPCYVYGTSEIIATPPHRGIIGGYWEVPAGGTLYVRGHCATTVTSGYNARVIGIGG